MNNKAWLKNFLIGFVISLGIIEAGIFLYIETFMPLETVKVSEDVAKVKKVNTVKEVLTVDKLNSSYENSNIKLDCYVKDMKIEKPSENLVLTLTNDKGDSFVTAIIMKVKAQQNESLVEQLHDNIDSLSPICVNGRYCVFKGRIVLIITSANIISK